MSNAADMSTPVTRGELQEELAAAVAPLATKAELAPLATKAELAAAIAPLATKAELAAAIAPLATKAELAAAVAPLASKTELEFWGGALLARIEASEQGLKELIKATEQGLKELIQASEQGLKELVKATERQLQMDLERHTGAILESVRAQIAGLDDKYRDLPGRVNRLEDKVFGPESR